MKRRIDLDTFNEITYSLLRNKSRSLLTGFGIFWGLFMLLVMLGAGQGVKGLLVENFEGFASNACIIVSNNTSKPYKGLKEGRYWNLDYKDLDRLRMMVPELDAVTPVISQWGITAVNDAHKSSVSVQGIDSEYSGVEIPEMKYGRYINEVDIMQDRKVCVIGKRVYNDLFPDGEDPCGKFIDVGGVFFQIVGVNFSNCQLSINGSTATKILIPITVAQKLYWRGNHVDIICMTARSGVSISSLESRIRQVMGREHMFDPEDEPALQFINTEQIFTMMDTLFRGVDFLILLIGLGTLFAGAVGVSNIMMVAVRARTTEIGIRRAIGATPRDILGHMLLESVALTMVAGLLGIEFTVFVLMVVEAAVGKAGFQISFGLGLAAVALVGALGIGAGFLPALRAMKIKPVEAMREE